MRDFAVTFFYKSIIPDLETFSELANKYVPYLGLGTTYTAEQWQPIAQAVYNQYCNSNVNYDSADAFCRHFFGEFADELPRFVARRKVIDAEYGLTLKELTNAGTYIDNVANRPNSVVDDPLNTVVPYISSQNSGKREIPKIDAYLRALDDFTNGYMRDFLDKFKHHFIAILPDGIILFKE